MSRKQYVNEHLMCDIDGNTLTAVLELRLFQGSLLKKVLESIKDLVTNANFDCSATDFSLQAVDSSHVALVALLYMLSVVKGVNEEEFDWGMVMDECFGQIDEEVSGISVAKMVGSTAVAAVVTEDKVVLANCSDCRAVLSRFGGCVALALSSDHKPDRADELERIESAGGNVINWNGSRVLGVLSTSRSIGD